MDYHRRIKLLKSIINYVVLQVLFQKIKNKVFDELKWPEDNESDFPSKYRIRNITSLAYKRQSAMNTNTRSILHRSVSSECLFDIIWATSQRQSNKEVHIYQKFCLFLLSHSKQKKCCDRFHSKQRKFCHYCSTT